MVPAARDTPDELEIAGMTDSNGAPGRNWSGASHDCDDGEGFLEMLKGACSNVVARQVKLRMPGLGLPEQTDKVRAHGTPGRR